MNKLIILMVVTSLISACGQSQEQKQIDALKQQNQQLLQQEQLLTQQRQNEQQYQQQQQPVQQQQYMPPQQVAPAPIIVQSAPAPVQSNGGPNNMVQDMMIGGLLGHAMAGGSGNRNNYSQPNVTRNVTINRTYVAPTRPAVAPSYRSSTSSVGSSSRRR